MALVTTVLGVVQSVAQITTDIPSSPTQPNANPVGCVGTNIIGTFVATLQFEGTTDGANWFSVAAYPILASGLLGAPVTSTTAKGSWSIPVYGYNQVRVRASSYTSGAATVLMDVATSAPSGQIPVSTEGLKSSYVAAIPGMAVVASATQIACIVGSATKNIRITRVIASGTIATAAAYGSVELVMRSAATTGGTPVAATLVPLDSNDAAATATVNGTYASNPSTGTPVGTVATQRYSGILTGTVTILPPPVIFDFGVRNARCPVLRGTAQELGLLLNGFGANASTWDVSFEWTEE